MFLIKERFSSIKEFEITSQSSFYLKEDGLYHQTLKYDYIEGDFFGSIIRHNETVIIVQSFLGWFFVIKNETFLPQKYNGFYCHGITGIDEVFFFDNTNKKLATIIDENVKFLEYEKPVLGVPGGFIDMDESSYIKFLDKSFTIKAEFEVKDLGNYWSGVIEKANRISTLSGAYRTTIVFTLENGDIVLLDFLTGRVLERINEAKISHNLQPVSLGSPVFWGANHMTFIEVNAEKAALTKQIDLSSELKRMANIPDTSPNYIGIHTSIVYNGLIYFLADKEYLCIFSPSQEKIIWWHKFQFEKKGTMLKGGAKNLQVTDRSIYVLDSSNTLHVFEKDKTA